MFFVLDSTVLIDCLRGKSVAQRVLGLRVTGDVPCTTAINIEEIVRGLRDGEEKKAIALFEGLVVLTIGIDEAIVAGQWRRDFANRGVTLAQADCLIASAALHAGAVLATGNPNDFPMPDVRVDHWPVGV